MFDVIEPATGERLASVPEAERHDVDRAVVAADRAFRSGDWPKI
ncbi:MAG TPA: aldehyde dehydrogenase family protein, partial [Thermoanaerobaculia bacterium]|nr:aldehyde dehydrogenase family protein [Thermoanaerobaculia bacterium]